MNLENIMGNAKKRIKTLACAGLVGLALAASAEAAIIYVSPGESIQAAIDSAFTGDEVHVNPGTYYGKVNMKDSVDLIGSGADVTIMDAQGSDDYGVVYALNIQDPTTTVAGFTLRNGGFNCDGVKLSNSRMIIERNIIRDNGGGSMSYAGNGIGVLESVAVIRNNTIYNNIGVGIWIQGYQLTLEPSSIFNNIVIGNYEGIDSISHVPPILSNNDVWGNPHNDYYNVTSTDDISEDPLFIGNGNYHLQSGSPCIDTGLDIGLPYHGSAPDMGAFEYIPEPATMVLLALGGLAGLLVRRRNK